jgi:hypothetical protein
MFSFVHCSVHAWSGQCNKNLGNAFVIVWRIGDEHTLAASQAQRRLRGGGGVPGAGSGSNVDNMQSSVMSSKSIKKQGSGSNNSGGSNDLPEMEAGGKIGRKVAIDLRRVPGVDILGKLSVELCVKKYCAQSALWLRGNDAFMRGNEEVDDPLLKSLHESCPIFNRRIVDLTHSFFFINHFLLQPTKR